MPESAPETIDGDVGVVIPLRSLRAGKRRLAEALDNEARAQLITAMAVTVVTAAGDLPVLVVHEDPEVAPWAQKLGAWSTRPNEPGLNRAVTHGRTWFAHRGVASVIVAHADLPLVTDLAPVADFDGITLVPDRHADGTNILCVPTDADFDFAYGPGSFETHLEVARATGLPIRILDDDPTYRCDVDHPDDLIAADLTIPE